MIIKITIFSSSGSRGRRSERTLLSLVVIMKLCNRRISRYSADSYTFIRCVTHISGTEVYYSQNCCFPSKIRKDLYGNENSLSVWLDYA